MININRFIENYTTCEIFEADANWFWIVNNQVGDCGLKEYPFVSKLYQYFEIKRKTDYGYHGSLLTLKAELILDYFFNIEDDEVLFAVIFAHWCELRPGQISYIRKAKRDKTAWDRLFSALDSPENIYFIETENGEIPAVKEGIYLIADDGTKYEIN